MRVRNFFRGSSNCGARENQCHAESPAVGCLVRDGLTNHRRYHMGGGGYPLAYQEKRLPLRHRPVDDLDKEASYGCDHEVGGHKSAGLVSVSLPYCCMFWRGQHG